MLTVLTLVADIT